MVDDRLVKVVGQVLGIAPGTITTETGADNTPAWDSVGHLNLVLEIESVFGVRFSSQDIPLLTSVGRIQEVLSRQRVI
jgi:acyl carrier protein